MHRGRGLSYELRELGTSMQIRAYIVVKKFLFKRSDLKLERVKELE
jgi:hypothetical protein